jgi:hypothetical protein
VAPWNVSIGCLHFLTPRHEPPDAHTSPSRPTTATSEPTYPASTPFFSIPTPITQHWLALPSRAVDNNDINFFLEVVQEVIDRGLAPSLANISSQLAPKGREHEITEALAKLVAQGRLIKRTTLVAWPEEKQATPTELDHYYPSPPK